MTPLAYRLGRWAWGGRDKARSLTSVLPAIAVMIMAGLLALLGIIMTKSTRESALNERGNILATEAKTFAGLLDQSISRELADLGSRAASLIALGLHQDPARLSRWVDAIQGKLPEYTWVGVADRNGLILASSARQLSGQSVSPRDWFKQGLTGPAIVDLHEAKLLEPFLPTRTDGPWRFIDLAVPLQNDKGEGFGVIGAHLSWDWLMSVQRRFAATLPLPRHAEVVVAGLNGKARLAGVYAESWPFHELKSFQRAAAGETGWVRETWPDRNEYIVGFSASPNSGKRDHLDWVTLIRVPTQGFDSAAAYASNGIWVLICAILALFYISIRLMLRIALSPVARLVTEVSEVAQHGGRVDLTAPTPREFQVLGQATNQMIQAIEASQSADFAKSKFLADMSHEVRTLLHGMLSHAELTQLDHQGKHAEKDLAKTIDYGRELTALLNDILDLSAIGEGKLRLDEKTTQIAELIRSNAQLYERIAVAKGLHFNVDIGVDESFEIIIDPLRLGQVLRNLIANAVKFTLQGSVTIRAGFEQHAGQQRLCIRIRDTGIGLTQAQQEMVFGRFEQADSSLRARFGGSGLGLSLARALTQAMGAEISLCSEPGQGSEFLLILPVRTSLTEICASNPNAPPGQPSRLRVLCVDDLAENRAVMCRWLLLQGHEADQAESGQEALEKANNQVFDLILMDIDLPDMQGTDVIQKMREGRGKSAEAVIYTVSGHAYDSDINRSLAAGSDGHISKPVDYKQLREQLGRIKTPG